MRIAIWKSFCHESVVEKVKACRKTQKLPRFKKSMEKAGNKEFYEIFFYD
jgi:hypothetical protein